MSNASEYWYCILKVNKIATLSRGPHKADWSRVGLGREQDSEVGASAFTGEKIPHKHHLGEMPKRAAFSPTSCNLHPGPESS